MQTESPTDWGTGRRDLRCAGVILPTTHKCCFVPSTQRASVRTNSNHSFAMTSALRGQHLSPLSVDLVTGSLRLRSPLGCTTSSGDEGTRGLTRVGVDPPLLPVAGSRRLEAPCRCPGPPPPGVGVTCCHRGSQLPVALRPERPCALPAPSRVP